MSSASSSSSSAVESVIRAACDVTSSSKKCYAASWYMIGDQLINWLLVQIPISLLSILLEWLEIQTHPTVERLQKLLQSPFVTFVNHVVQLVTSLYVCVSWIVRGGSLTVNFSAWSVESLFLIATSVGYGMRWIAAKNKATYTLKLHCLFDILSTVSHFSLFPPFDNPVIVSNAYKRSWLDFGFLRSYLIYIVMDRLFTRYKNKTFFSQILLVVLKACCAVFFAASVLFSLERLGDLPYTNSFLLHVYKCSDAADPTAYILAKNSSGIEPYTECEETWSWFASIYFMFVTVSTVGYGDFTPKTVLGRIMVCVIIVVGIYTFANESATLLSIYGDQRHGRVKYHGSRNTAHVIVTGNPSAAQLKDFIREFFHPDHDLVFKTTQQQMEEENPENPNDPEDLEAPGTPPPIKRLVNKWVQKHHVRETHVVVLMRFDEDNASVQQDVLAFVQAHPQYRRRVFFMYGSALRKDDLRNAKLHQALAVFFLPNKFANDGNKEDAATVLRVLAVSQQAQAHTQLFAMLVNSQNRTLLEATGLRSDHLVCADEIRLGLMGLSCRCPGLSTLVSNLITSRSSGFEEWPVEAALLAPSWAQEYVTGASNEIYSCVLAPHFVGRTFMQAAQQIYRESGGQVLLIAVEYQCEIFFNPGHWFRLKDQCKGYMIAECITKLRRFSSSAVVDCYSAKATMALLKNRSNLIARARRAQHQVERRIPQSIRDQILRFEANASIATGPMPPSAGLLAQGGHIVVCSNVANEGGGGRSSLLRLINFLRPLRAPHIERMVPVVIVDAQEFDIVSWMQLSAFGEVYHMRGSPQRHQVLVAAGVYSASAVVVLAQGTETGYDDSKAIFNAILVNAALRSNRIFTIIELRDVQNNRFLDPVACANATDIWTEEMETRGSPQHQNHSSYVDSPRPSVMERPASSQPLSRDSRQFYNRSSVSHNRKLTWIDTKKLQAQRLCADVREFFLGNIVDNVRGALDGPDCTFDQLIAQEKEHDTFFQERFMSGALFPSYVADDLLIQSFFNPSLNLFIRKILDGKSCFMLYDIPKSMRRCDATAPLLYGELFEKMTSSIAHALPIGLLRAKGGPLNAPCAYVYTSPNAETVVYPDDKVFVIIDVMTLHRVANKLQRRFRNRKKSIEEPVSFAETVQVTSNYASSTEYM